MDFATLTAGLGAFGIAMIAFFIGLTALGFWVTYTLIWRAVRRGIREARIEPITTASRPPRAQRHAPAPRAQGPRDW